MPGQPTYPCIAGHFTLGKPPPSSNTAPNAKRSLPFQEFPITTPLIMLNQSRYGSDDTSISLSTPDHGPLIATPHGTFLNPAYRADPVAYSAAPKPCTRAWAGTATTSVPGPVHAAAPSLPYPQAQISFPYHCDQSAFPYQMQPFMPMPCKQPSATSSADAFAPMTNIQAEHRRDGGHRIHLMAPSAISAISAAGVSSLSCSAKCSVGLRTQSTHKPAP